MGGVRFPARVQKLKTQNMNTEPLNVHDSNKGMFETYTRRLVDINNVYQDVICERDIAHALSNICRFGGHTIEHYSVAEHSILVAALAPEDFKLEALLHDAAEAYVGDVIKPLKNLLGNSYTDIEDRFMTAICKKFNLNPIKLAAIKQYDLQALDLEHDAFKLGKAVAYVKITDLQLTEAGHVFQTCEVSQVFLSLLYKYARKANPTEAFNQHFV